MNGKQHFEAGVGYYKQGNYKVAIEAFEAAITVEPDNADYHEQLAISWFHAGDKDAALVSFNKAQKLEPNNPYRYSSRAYVRDSLGDTAGAVEDYRIAIKLDPLDAVAYNNLGLLEEKLGYKQKAEKYFKKADELAEEYGFGPEFQQEKEAIAKETPIEDAAKDLESSENSSVGSEMKRALFSKDGRREFWHFLKNGFRLKDNQKGQP